MYDFNMSPDGDDRDLETANTPSSFIFHRAGSDFNGHDGGISRGRDRGVLE